MSALALPALETSSLLAPTALRLGSGTSTEGRSGSVKRWQRYERRRRRRGSASVGWPAGRGTTHTGGALTLETGAP